MSGNSTNVSSVISRMFHRKREERRKHKTLAKRCRRTFHIEDLEKREMFAISTIGVYSGALQMWTDNNSTSVTVSQVGSNVHVLDSSTNHSWDFALSGISRIDFIGGAGNDTFVNNIPTMHTRAWGQGGNDYLEGYNAVDEFYGGDGNDTLVGYGGNDILDGGNGNDVIRGGAGADQMWGDAGDDYMDGGTENDMMWGGDGDDTLLGGAGDDQLVGDNGNDHLNGQAGNDKMWGAAGNDTLIAIDNAFNDMVDGGDGNDTLWVDRLQIGSAGTLTDTIQNPSSADVVQNVSYFSNGADKTLDGDNIADPSDYITKAHYTNTITADNIHGSNPLFASAGLATIDPFTGAFTPHPAGPRTTDPVQSPMVGDCFLISSLSSIAAQTPSVITQNVVDFDDGTYGVHLGSKYYRVDNELSTWLSFSGPTAANVEYAALGAGNSMWVAVVEKAYASYYSSAGTMQALNAGGHQEDVFTAFNMRYAGSYQLSTTYGSGYYLANDFANRLAQGFSITTSVMASDGSSHAFTVSGLVRNAAGTITAIVLRNPWGYDGLTSFPNYATGNGGTNANDGYFSLTPDQLFHSGGWVDWAVA